MLRRNAATTCSNTHTPDQLNGCYYCPRGKSFDREAANIELQSSHTVGVKVKAKVEAFSLIERDPKNEAILLMKFFICSDTPFETRLKLFHINLYLFTSSHSHYFFVLSEIILSLM